jgi:hypothetical protein
MANGDEFTLFRHYTNHFTFLDALIHTVDGT